MPPINQYAKTREELLKDTSIANAITGGLGILGSVYGMSQQRLNLPQDGFEQQYSATGEPVYGFGQEYNAISDAKAQGTNVGEALSMTAQGAAAGTSVLPGLGTAIGAGFGLLSSLVGGGIRKRKQQQEIDKSMNRATIAQQSFNRADQYYDQQQATQQGYRRRRDMNSRLYNLYSLPTTRFY